jgi:hypothetical protein
MGKYSGQLTACNQNSSYPASCWLPTECWARALCLLATGFFPLLKPLLYLYLGGLVEFSDRADRKR